MQIFEAFIVGFPTTYILLFYNLTKVLYKRSLRENPMGKSLAESQRPKRRNENLARKSSPPKILFHRIS
jgi:hypothetical protein